MEKLNLKQKISVIALIISFSGVFGFIYELIFYYFNDGKLTYQGGNFLPWINIYAIGGILVLLSTYKIKDKPILIFLISMIVTGLLEYFSGLVLYEVFNTRFWDYNIEILNFGNIGGYVCLRSVLFFAISSVMLMKVILPFFIRLVKKSKTNLVLIISVILCTLFIVDELYNLIIPKVTSLPSANKIYKDIGIK